MTSELPDWQPYDPSAPAGIAPFDDDSHMVVLLATPAAESGGWAHRVAVSLARQWAGTGERVFLADLGLMRPRLHLELGLPNEEGMSDAFLYGASLPRVAKSANGGFFFASAGTPVVDGRRVLESPRWDLFVHGFTRAGARLLVYIPTDADGRDVPLGRADQVILLATEAERADVIAGGAEGAVVGLFPAAASEPLAPAPKEAAASPVSPVPGLPTTPFPACLPGRASPGAGRIVLALAIVAAVVLALLSVLGLIEVPGLSGAPTPPTVTDVAVASSIPVPWSSTRAIGADMVGSGSFTDDVAASWRTESPSEYAPPE